MDKIFTYNRFFIGFCALLVIAIIAANYARDQLLLEEAKVIGKQEAEWQWRSQGVTTHVSDLKAKIVKRTENDAQVEVEGKQKVIIGAPDINPTALAGSEVKTSQSDSDFKAILTLYKHGNSKVWLLGKVEGQ